MRILLVEEHPERERLALELAIRSLRARGHEVVLTDTWHLEEDEARVRPDLVLDNVSDSVPHFVGKWRHLGPHQRNVNLIWEQLVNPANQYRFRFDETLSSRLVDGRVAWGDAFRDALLMENPAMDPSRVKVVGSIKHASHVLLKHVPSERLLRFFPEHLAAFERRVLFVDSYPAALYDPMPSRAMTGDRPLPYLYEMIRYLTDLRAPALELLSRLAAENPRVLFIVRLHPTKLENYRAHFGALEGVPNLVIESEGDIGPLVRLADLVIAARSGSLVEAHLAGVPAVSLCLDQHPFRRIGLTDSVEERFAPTLALDAGACPSLAALSEAAASFHPDPSMVATWTHDPGPRTFVRLAEFLEETLAREPVSRSIPPASALAPASLRRHARLALRRRGLGKSPARLAPSFDFGALATLIEEHAQKA